MPTGGQRVWSPILEKDMQVVRQVDDTYGRENLTDAHVRI